MKTASYKIDLVGGPLCGMVLPRVDLPDSVTLIYQPDLRVSDHVVYRRVVDGRAFMNEKSFTRYSYAGLEGVK